MLVTSFTDQLNLWRLPMPPEVNAADNYGNCCCVERHCIFFAARCSWDFCEICCTAIHSGLSETVLGTHAKPWDTRIGFKPPVQQENVFALNAGVMAEINEEIAEAMMKDAENKAAANADASKLPAIYKAKAKVPEPRPLKETTKDCYLMNRGDVILGP